MNGNGETVELLLAGGPNPSLRAPKVGSVPAGWAEHGGQPELADRLRSLTANS